MVIPVLLLRSYTLNKIDKLVHNPSWSLSIHHQMHDSHPLLFKFIISAPPAESSENTFLMDLWRRLVFRLYFRKMKFQLEFCPAFRNTFFSSLLATRCQVLVSVKKLTILLLLLKQIEQIFHARVHYIKPVSLRLCLCATLEKTEVLSNNNNNNNKLFSINVQVLL